MKYIGNCKHLIDWNSIIESLKIQQPAYTGPRHRASDPIKGIDNIFDKWYSSGYVLAADGGSAGWDMFFPEQHFSKSVVDTFSNFVGINPVNAWISRVNPGMVVPWHWDANDKEEEYSQLPDMLRFSCHISPAEVGHVFIVDGECLYNQEQGNTYLWESRKSWHGGGNFGMTPKYLFNIFGHKI